MEKDPKQLVDEVKNGFEEFKKTNDELLAAKAEGKAVGELTEKVEKINSAIEKMEEMKSKLATVETAIARSGSFGKDEEKNEEIEAANEAMSVFMRKGENALTVDQKSAIETFEKKFLSVQSDPDGGYFVMPDSSGRMVKQIFETSPMRSVASIQTISTDSLEGFYDDDEAGAAWVGEAAARPETTNAQVGQWKIPVHEQYAEPKATQKVLEDSAFNIESWHEMNVSGKFSRAENTAFVSGNGSAKPRGFTTYDASAVSDVYERGKIGRQISNSVGAIEFDDIMDLVGLVKEGWLANSTFAGNRSTFSAIRKLKDNDDRYLWEPSNQAGQPSLLVGYPTIQFNDMADVGTGNLALALADWSATYQIVDRVGISVLRDPYTTKGFVKFYTRKRVGGDVINFDSIKLLEIQ